MKAHVIIGANFGDEGKGATTDYLCRKLDNGIVIRFNGGAQAGHTVVTPQGERHVYSHLGSGTFTKTPTYLTEHFVANPVEYIKELEKFIETFDTRPLIESIVHIHPACPVTTPFDTMFNWARENARRVSGDQHGSCGIGINETVTRHSFVQHRITVADLIDKSKDSLRNILRAIRDDYYFRRTTPDIYEQLDDDWFEDSIIDTFLETCTNFTSFVRVRDYSMLKQFNHLVFEGAQGLLLDEDHDWYPHVTRSKTGLPNVGAVLKHIGVKKADVYYITRSYLTRHGAGPLPNEVHYPLYDGIEDHTNVTNHFQGKLRFAPLNLDLLKTSIESDMRDTRIEVHPKLVMTCVDQLPEEGCKYVEDCVEFSINKSKLLKLVNKAGPWETLITSSSPTYEQFRVYQPPE